MGIKDTDDLNVLCFVGCNGLVVGDNGFVLYWLPWEHSREFVDYRHPDSRRVWKEGSGQHFPMSIQRIRGRVPNSCSSTQSAAFASGKTLGRVLGGIKSLRGNGDTHLLGFHLKTIVFRYG